MSIMTGTKQTKERRKKPDELLGSVVRETAIPAAVELLRANEKFALPSGKAWGVLVLAADKIGGLSKRHGRNEAKGSFIELIESDQVLTVATADMLREEVFGIIPTAETLERMSEYSMLTNVDYDWAIASVEGEDLNVKTIREGTFTQAQAIATTDDPEAGAAKLHEALGGDVWDSLSGETTPAVSQADAPDDSGAQTQEFSVIADDEDDASNFDDDEPSFADEDAPAFSEDEDSDAPIFADETPESLVPAPAAAPVDEAEVDEPIEPEVIPAQPSEPPVAAYTEPVAEDEDDETESWDEDEVLTADQEQIRDTIARRFLGDDLGLNIDLSEYWTTFSVGAPTVQIGLPEGTTGWLGDQIAQLTRQANAEIARLHNDGQEELQAEYVNLMSMCAKDVIKEVATDRAGGIYKGLLEQAEIEHREREGEKEAKVAVLQKGIREEYEASAKKVGEQARLQAELEYSDRNKPRLSRELGETESHVTSEIEDRYSHDRVEILRLRRKTAEQKMFAGQSRVFEVMAEKHATNLAAERDLLSEWTAKIDRIIAGHRTEDINRANALAEEQKRFDQVAALKKEHEELIESMRTDHTERGLRMEQELERMRTSTVEQLRSRDEEWGHQLAIEKANTATETKRVADLISQGELMSQSFQKQYDDRINEFEADKRNTNDALTRAARLQDNSTKLMTMLIIASGLVMFGVGFILAGLLF